jgi:hypothetical protein
VKFSCSALALKKSVGLWPIQFLGKAPGAIHEETYEQSSIRNFVLFHGSFTGPADLSHPGNYTNPPNPAGETTTLIVKSNCFQIAQEIRPRGREI